MRGSRATDAPNALHDVQERLLRAGVAVGDSGRALLTSAASLRQRCMRPDSRSDALMAEYATLAGTVQAALDFVAPLPSLSLLAVRGLDDCAGVRDGPPQALVDLLAAAKQLGAVSGRLSTALVEVQSRLSNLAELAEDEAICPYGAYAVALSPGTLPATALAA